jgi:hypothetical protein
MDMGKKMRSRKEKRSTAGFDRVDGENGAK